jgi:uncharacterized protein
LNSHGSQGKKEEGEGDVKFAADCGLGKLSKWLRLLGYDTTFYRGRADKPFLQAAQREGRVALTRGRAFAGRQFQGRLLIIKADKHEDQLREVFNALKLKVDSGSLLRLCLKCNELLKKVPRCEVEGLVPNYIFEHQTEFRICPICRGIFWPGTHGEHARRGLIERIQTRLP